MREILFRAKQIHLFEWGGISRGDFIYGYLSDKYHINNNGDRLIDSKTIGQYTGLKDKNGKKIFEGDICLCNRNISDSIDKITFEIKYDVLDGFYGESKYDNFIESTDFKYCEVIGSVFDNSELLEVCNENL